MLRVFAGLEAPHTQTSRMEREVLLRQLPGKKTIVEIGVYEGSTTALLAEKADLDSTVYGIDPFFPGRLGICWGEVIAKHVTRTERASGRVRLVRRLSHEASDEVPGKVDFIFIDGDHSLEGIRRDWETWAPRVRSGGILALHDSFPRARQSPTLGSQRFYAERIASDPRYEEIAREGSLAILRKCLSNDEK